MRFLSTLFLSNQIFGFSRNSILKNKFDKARNVSRFVCWKNRSCERLEALNWLDY